MAYQPSTSLRAKLKRKTLPFRARRMLSFTLTKPVVSFTFDDFPRSAIINGSDVLEAQGWRASFYVAAGLVGADNHHGEHFRAVDILALSKKGHEIAGHTYSHIDCDTLGLRGTYAEIDRNLEALKSMGHTQEIEHFAYPFGAANARLKRGLQDRFKTMRGVRAGVHCGVADLNDLKSTPLYSGKALDIALESIRNLNKKPGWLILFAHDIQDKPSEWGCTQNEFKSIVEAVNNSGADVLPIGATLNHLKSSKN